MTQYTAKFRKHSSPLGPAHSTSRSTTMTVCWSSGAPGRTGSLPCPDRRFRDLRRTGQIVDAVPLVPLLDDPVPQMAEQLRDILHFFCTFSPDPEQVIEVPKILLDDVPMRAAERDTQLGEQLVEVPTQPWYVAMVLASKVYSRRELRRIIAGLERGGGGARGGLQGSRAGQNSTEYLEQIVENPVPQVRREGGGGLQGSLPVQNSAAVVEHIVDIPARRGLPGFLSGQRSASSSSRSHDVADEDFTGFFRFEKKCEVGLALGVGTAPRVEPIHAASL